MVGSHARFIFQYCHHTTRRALNPLSVSLHRKSGLLRVQDGWCASYLKEMKDHGFSLGLGIWLGLAGVTVSESTGVKTPSAAP
jgi:hypothetical protein